MDVARSMRNARDFAEPREIFPVMEPFLPNLAAPSEKGVHG